MGKSPQPARDKERHGEMERQHRGFSAERRFADNLPAMELSNSYTAKDDGRIWGIPVSIKSTRIPGEMCLGSASRIFSCSYPLLLFAEHRQRDTNAPYGFDVLALPDGFYGTLPPSCRGTIVQAVRTYDAYMRQDADCSREHDYEWHERIDVLGQRYQEACAISGMPAWIAMRPKRGHHGQHRLQCAIPKDSYWAFVTTYRAFPNIGTFMYSRLDTSAWAELDGRLRQLSKALSSN